MPTRQTVHLIDASPYLFRAYFSLPSSLVDPLGRPNAAVHGFAQFLARYLNEERPTHVSAAFDRSLTTSFRNELYPLYKSGRELPPPELVDQLTRCEQTARAFGIHAIAHERYEADDLIGVLARRALEEGHRVSIVSSDKDLAQLVGANVQLHDFARGERHDVAGVVEKFGVPPERIVDLLALAGDPVDDIPGVRGIGRVTAVRLLQVFRDLDDLYERLAEVAELPWRGALGLRAKLEEGRETAFLSRELARVRDILEEGDPPSVRELEWRGVPEGESAVSEREELGIARIAARVERI